MWPKRVFSIFELLALSNYHETKVANEITHNLDFTNKKIFSNSILISFCNQKRYISFLIFRLIVNLGAVRPLFYIMSFFFEWLRWEQAQDHTLLWCITLRLMCNYLINFIKLWRFSRFWRNGKQKLTFVPYRLFEVTFLEFDIVTYLYLRLTSLKKIQMYRTGNYMIHNNNNHNHNSIL